MCPASIVKSLQLHLTQISHFSRKSGQAQILLNSIYNCIPHADKSEVQEKFCSKQLVITFVIYLSPAIINEGPRLIIACRNLAETKNQISPKPHFYRQTSIYGGVRYHDFGSQNFGLRYLGNGLSELLEILYANRPMSGLFPRQISRRILTRCNTTTI